MLKSTSDDSDFDPPQFCESRCFKFPAIEHVEGVERNEAFAVGVSNVDAALLYAPDVEGFGVDKLDDQHAEEIFVTEVFRDEDLGQTAEQFAQG